MAFAIDQFDNSEYLCPCPGSGDTAYVSLSTGEIYCAICATGPATSTVFNPYTGSQYCICAGDLDEPTP